ncbi:hypothetical protein O3P69_005919 [Scylla paramamosain]|uniref:Uncharacterized protein n=1 Tax=Scylla paramamosain TaxID=85552 RepID=A0AAW0U448_SCYPA
MHKAFLPSHVCSGVSCVRLRASKYLLGLEGTAAPHNLRLPAVMEQCCLVPIALSLKSLQVYSLSEEALTAGSGIT